MDRYLSKMIIVHSCTRFYIYVHLYKRYVSIWQVCLVMLTQHKQWMQTNPACSQFIYPLIVAWTTHWSSLTSDWQFTWNSGYDALITVVTQCRTPIAINVHNLERGVSFGIYRVCRSVYSFTQYQHLILIWLTQFV